MIITVTNTAGHPISIEWFQLGVLETGQSVTKSLSSEEAHSIAGIMKKLVDLNKISVSVVDDPTLLDKVETATIESSLILTTATTLYVTTTGSDTSGDGSVGNPFRQIQRALVELEKYKQIRAIVTISVGAGAFNAFAVDGERLHIVSGAGPGETAGQLLITGTTQTPTLATGATSGTFSASATWVDGSPVCVDSAATWTIGDLKGKHVRVGSNTYLITDNTATTFRVVGTATSLFTSGTAYSFIEPSSTINSSTSATLTSSSAASIVVANTNAARAGSINISNLAIDHTSGSVVCVNVQNSGVTLTSMRLKKTGGSGNLITMGSTAAMTVSNTHFQASAPASVPFAINRASASGTLFLSTCYFDVSAATTVSVAIAETTTSQACATTCSGCTFVGGVAIGVSSPGTYLLANRFVSCATAIKVGPAAGSSGLLGHWLGVGGFTSASTPSYFGSCTTIVSATGSGLVAMGSFTSASNTNGIVISKGMRVQIDSTSTVGVSGNELSVDGVTGTLATMRGNSPKVFPLVPNAYGSYVYE